MRVNSRDLPLLAPGIKSRKNTWKVWLVKFWIRTNSNFNEDVMVSTDCWAVCCNCSSWAVGFVLVNCLSALAMIRGAFSWINLTMSASKVTDVSHGDWSRIGWNKMRPWTFLWSARWATVLDLSLAENKNFKFVLSSCVWKAACAAPKQMLVIFYPSKNWTWFCPTDYPQSDWDTKYMRPFVAGHACAVSDPYSD